MGDQVSTYASGFKMPTVNAINFRTVFDDLSAKLADNPAVLSTVLVILFIYVLGLVWARRMDKKDIEKVSVKSSVHS